MGDDVKKVLEGREQRRDSSTVDDTTCASAPASAAYTAAQAGVFIRALTRNSRLPEIGKDTEALAADLSDGKAGSGGTTTAAEAVASATAFLNDVIVGEVCPGDFDVAAECVRRLRAAADGGDSGLDVHEHAAGCTITVLPTETTGFASWSRDSDDKRGRAEWVVPPIVYERAAAAEAAAAAGASAAAAAEKAPGGGGGGGDEGGGTGKSGGGGGGGGEGEGGGGGGGVGMTEDRLVYLHGGGYEYYAPWEKYRPLTTRLAVRCGMPVLAIDYRKLPEHAYPSAVIDAVDALAWARSNCPITGKDSPARRVFLSGDSAGGGLALAAVNAILLRETGGEESCPLSGSSSSDISHNGSSGAGRDASDAAASATVVSSSTVNLLPDALALISPYTDQLCAHESYRTRAWRGDDASGGGGGSGDPIFSDGDGVSESIASAEGAKAYYNSGRTGANIDPRHPCVSPCFASPDLLARLPPTLVLVGDAEQMLGDSTQLAIAALEAGAPELKLLIFERMWHVWPMYTEGCGQGEPGTLQAAERALDEMASFLSRQRI